METDPSSSIPSSPSDTASRVPAGMSVWEREIFQHLRHHVAEEQRLLEEYIEASRETASKALSYLINLLVADERRHHELFLQLAESLENEAEMRIENPAVPRLDLDQENRAGVLEMTDRLLAREETDLRELKHLRQELKAVKDTTLWDLLVELMERDTSKHIAILRFARDHARHPPF